MGRLEAGKRARANRPSSGACSLIFVNRILGTEKSDTRDVIARVAKTGRQGCKTGEGSGASRGSNEGACKPCMKSAAR